jgi:AcrR family transcriptional regulator
MTKGVDTKKSILEKALNLSSEVGLEGLSIGTLARRVGMSKSGLYAHFGSKEELQCEVLDTAANFMTRMVIRKAIQEPRGLPRVKALFSYWLEWSMKAYSGGCPFVGAATELDDREGPVRGTLVRHMESLFQVMEKAADICVEERHFRRDLDRRQFAFEFWAIMLSFHHFARLMRSDDAEKRAGIAFERLLEDARA